MARRPKAPKDMSTLLNSTTGTLAQIKAKTNSLNQLCDIVRQICPDLPEDAFNIANFVQSTLVIEVKSPVWGQRLQFERNKICQELVKETSGEFSKIEIKINPHGFKQEKAIQAYTNKAETSGIKQPQIHTSKSLNSATAKQLLEVAKNAPKGLKEKLEKLAKVAGSKKG